jgi:LytS/YehU family sensor histidine kinase
LRQQGRIQKLLATQIEKENDIKRQRYIVWGLSLALLVFGGLIYMLIRNIRQKQRANMQIKLQSLRAQMNPHFIFNSLNSIQHLVIKNESQQAFSYLSKFSKLLRMILETSDKPYILLEKEVEVLKLYLELEKLRFDSQFTTYFELEDEAEWADLKIPTLMLQPYVENAIWHGLLPKEGEKKLWIRVKVRDGYLLLEIEDNGIGRKKSGEIKSLQSVKYESRSTIINENRLNLIEERYRDFSRIEFVDLELGGRASGTLVKLTFPIQALLVYE